MSNQNSLEAALSTLGHVRDYLEQRSQRRLTLLEALRADLTDVATAAVALRTLLAVDVALTISLMPEIIPLATSDKFAGFVREVSGRLSWLDASRIVGPLVLDMLDGIRDEEDWIAYGDLLIYLGLKREVGLLIEKAKTTDSTTLLEEVDYLQRRARLLAEHD